MARVSTILCAADPGGEASCVERLIAAAGPRDADAIAVVGDLSAGGAADGYRAVFHALAKAGLPAFWVPGPGDAPLGTYVIEAHAIEATHPTLHGVHGTAALTPDSHVVVAGIGGEIDDDPGGERDEHTRLRYPRVEAEYRLKVLDELGEHERVLLFWSRPAHKHLGVGGSETVAELVKTYRPRLVVCDGGRGTETLGKHSLVVAPGSLRDGHYAVVDLLRHDVELAELASVPVRASG
jgi:Icc-related predicted phosphoesterase